MRMLESTWAILKVTWLFFSVLNVEVSRDPCRNRTEIKNRSQRRNNLKKKKCCWNDLKWDWEGESGAVGAVGRTEVGGWVIGPGKHEGRSIEEVIVQRKLNIHIYFTPWQFTRESEIEAGPIQHIKAGGTHARKVEEVVLTRIHTWVQSQTDPCKGVGGGGEWFGGRLRAKLLVMSREKHAALGGFQWNCYSDLNGSSKPSKCTCNWPEYYDQSVISSYALMTDKALGFFPLKTTWWLGWCCHISGVQTLWGLYSMGQV